GIGDDPSHVDTNRARLAEAIAAAPVYLEQVHGTRVATLRDGRPVAEPADGSVTTLPGIACTVQVADCLPVLFAAPAGVGAAHAGWRGLAGGVLEATVAALCEAVACRPSELRAWLGACIGPANFEVGADVLAAFGVAPGAPDASPRFVARDTPGKWLADLPGLARDRLLTAGVRDVSGGRWCTVADASRFFSFRRERVTGRMAGLVWIDAGVGRRGR
ncbi:MAG TPA: peptidoglycan editing factor PgeF, partial [Burkholderiaceae bacterium]|nr:peptidoglycan editing factor PgeF [Burkholderiaceae bacterium]